MFHRSHLAQLGPTKQYVSRGLRNIPHPARLTSKQPIAALLQASAMHPLSHHHSVFDEFFFTLSPSRHTHVPYLPPTDPRTPPVLVRFFISFVSLFPPILLKFDKPRSLVLPCGLPSVPHFPHSLAFPLQPINTNHSPHKAGFLR